MTDYPVTIRHHDGRRQDLPSAVDAEIYAPHGHAGSIAELVAKAEAYERIVEIVERPSRGGPAQQAGAIVVAAKSIIRRERAARINRDIETAERPPQLVADAR